MSVSVSVRPQKVVLSVTDGLPTEDQSGSAVYSSAWCVSVRVRGRTVRLRPRPPLSSEPASRSHARLSAAFPHGHRSAASSTARRTSTPSGGCAPPPQSPPPRSPIPPGAICAHACPPARLTSRPALSAPLPPLAPPGTQVRIDGTSLAEFLEEWINGGLGSGEARLRSERAAFCSELTMTLAN